MGDIQCVEYERQAHLLLGELQNLMNKELNKDIEEEVDAWRESVQKLFRDANMPQKAKAFGEIQILDALGMIYGDMDASCVSFNTQGVNAARELINRSFRLKL